MEMIVLFSLVLLTLTIPSVRANMCLLKMGSIYSTETKYCSGSSQTNTLKANACNEVIELFDRICSYNASFGELESQNVSKINCVVPCAGLEAQYISSMVNNGTGSCLTLCSKDPEAVAVLVALIHLKGFLAELKSKEEHTNYTVTSSASVHLQQSNLTSKDGEKEKTIKPMNAADGEKEKTTKPVNAADGEKEKTTKPVNAADGEKEKTTKPVNAADGEKEKTTKPVNAADGGEEKRTTPMKETDGGEEKTTTPMKETEPADNEGPTDDGLNNGDDEKSRNDNKLDDGDRPSKTGEKDETSILDETPSSYHFLIYFLAFIVICVAAYIVFHNKHKIIAFIIEGKQGRRGGRPSTKQYTPLKSKVEDVMPFIEKSTTQSNYIY